MRHLDDVILYLAAIFVALALSFSGCPADGTPRALGQDTPTRSTAILRGLRREDALLAAQACVHESSWRGGVGGTFDCGAQIQVVLARRFRGEHFRDALLRTMPRFAIGRTSRAWVRALPWGPMREDPAGWPAPYPARHDDPLWHAVVTRVRGFLWGVEALPCAQEPAQWFGRRTDHERLAAALASGRWREAECGETVNAYLTRAIAVAPAP